MSKRVRKNTLRRKSVKRRRNTKRRRRMMSGGGDGTIRNADAAFTNVRGWLTPGGPHDYLIPNGARVNFVGLGKDVNGLTKVRLVPPPAVIGWVGTKHVNVIHDPGTSGMWSGV